MKTGQILQFPLSRGLDEDTNAKSKPIATLRTGNNIRWPKAGVIGKRYGTRRLGDIEEVERFVVRGNELSAIAEGTIRSYNPITDTFSGVADISPTALEWSTLVDDESGVAVTDAVVSGDMLVHAWVVGDPTRLPEATPAPSSYAYVQVINWRTGQVLMTAQRVGGSDVVHVRVLLSGTTAFVFYSAGDEIAYVPVDLEALEVGSGDVLVEDLVDTGDHTYKGRFDAVFLASGSLAIVYERFTTGDSVIAAARYTLSGVTFAQAAIQNHTDGTYVDALAIAIAEDPTTSKLWILYCHVNSSPSARVRLRSVSNTTMAASDAVVTVHNLYRASQVSIILAQSPTMLCAWSGYEQASSRLPSMISAAFNATTEATDTRRRSMGLALVSRLFTLGLPHAFVADGRDGEDDGNTNSRATYPSTYLLRLDWVNYSNEIDGNPPHTLAGKIDHDIGGVFQSGCLPQGAVVDAETVLGLLPFQADAAQESFNWRCGLRLVRATQDLDLIADPYRSAAIGQETYIAGSYLGAWDGGIVFDYGMRAPIVIAATDNGANSGSMANGTYIYQLEPGFRSRSGVLHRGPLSDTVTVAIGNSPNNTGSVTLKVASHGIDGKQTESTRFGPQAGSGAYLNVFRTEANGSVLHQLTMAPRYNTFPNDPSDDVIELEDDHADNNINNAGDEDPNPGAIALSTRPQPYTADGSLEDCQPPAQYTLHYHGGRLFLVTGGRREIWFSKDLKENPSIAPGFSPLQIELYEQPITALASLDEKRIVFWERGLWYVVGDGPTVSGTDNRFSAPQIIQSDVGCTNPRSVVTTPMGVIFQSGTDLYLLGRDLSVSWIGQRAQDTLAAYPVITSAVLVAAQGEVRFTCNNSDGDAGLVLVFDYVRSTWFTRTYPGEGPITDAVLFGGVYYLALRDVPATVTEQVRYEDTEIHYDELIVSEDEEPVTVESYVTETVELDVIGPAGPIGWQRVRIAKMLGQSLANHAMTISVSRDFATTYEQTETFDAGSDVTAPSGHQRAEVALTVQRRQAVGLKFEDAEPANTAAYPIGNGAGFLLEGVALLVQPKPGLPRDTSSRRGG